MVLSQAATPRIAGAERNIAATLTAKCIRCNFLVAAVPCALIVAAAPQILKLLYGPAFLPASNGLRILALGIFVSSSASLFSVYYTLKLGKPMISFWNNALSAAVCLTLSVVLIPPLGIVGGATASTIAYLVGEVALLLLFIRDTGIPVASVLFVHRDDIVLLRGLIGAYVLKHRARAT
jgi:O-antigen/teichoic acid export membrane protein